MAYFEDYVPEDAEFEALSSDDEEADEASHQFAKYMQSRKMLKDLAAANDAIIDEYLRKRQQVQEHEGGGPSNVPNENKTPGKVKSVLTAIKRLQKQNKDRFKHQLPPQRSAKYRQSHFQPNR